MNDKAGGPAFPYSERLATGELYDQRAGMSLRDYFAAQAAGECFRQAMKRGFEGPQHIDQYTARAAFWAYGIADAMLTERSK